MEIIKNFGIDPILLLAQVVNFVIILFILNKLLYKPILKTLKKRRDSVQEGLRQAEESRIRLEKVIKDEKNILQNAYAKSNKIIEDAINHSNDLSKTIEENAKKQSEKILIVSQIQIEKQIKEAEQRLMLSVSNLAVKFVQKSAQGLFSQSEQDEVIKNALKKLESKKVSHE